MRRWALPLRGWLALAMLALILTPLLSWIGMLVAVMGPMKTEPTNFERMSSQRIMLANELLIGRPEAWGEEGFHAELRSLLDDVGVSVALIDAGGAPLLRTGSFERSRWPDWEESGLNSMGTQQQVGLLRNGEGLVTGLYVLEQNGKDPFNLLLVSVILGAITLVMLLAVWWIGRSINQPIQALADAAKAISREDLDFTLPSSRIREVNQLATAFAAMRDGLRASIASQAAMEQERRLLIGGIAHDLRTPLSSIRGYLEGLRDGIARSPDRMERYVAVALEKTGHLERMISDLFAFTQVEYLNRGPERELVGLGALLQEALDGMAPRALQAGVDLTLEGSGDVALHADRAMLTRAVENLLANGIRHTPAGGSVRIGYHLAEGGCQLWVADTGPGIPPADLERIFEPLYRGDEARGTKTGGAGLGLAIAQRFVQSHGGRIWAMNDGGARFTIWLPLK